VTLLLPESFPEQNRGPAAENLQAERVLRSHFPTLAVETLTAIPGEGSYSGAKIWRLRANGQDWAWRRWPQPGPPLPRLMGLHRLLRHVEREGLRVVAVPIADQEGQSVIVQEDHAWQLEPWKPGTADLTRDMTAVRLSAALQVLARWHLLAARYVPTTSDSSWFSSSRTGVCPAIPERATRLASLTERWWTDQEHRIPLQWPSARRELLKRVVRLSGKNSDLCLRRLRASEERQVPVFPALRDVWHAHVLLTGDQVTGLIDPSSCRTDSAAVDLARLLSSLGAVSPLLRGEALEAYQQIRPLSTEEWQLIPVLEQSGAILSLATWMTWLFEERRPVSDWTAIEQRWARIGEVLDGVRPGSPDSPHRQDGRDQF